MPLGLGQCRTPIKGSPTLCSLIHFSRLLLLGNQVSAKALLLLLQDWVFPRYMSQLVWTVLAQGGELLLVGEGGGQKVFHRERLGLS